MMEIWRNCWRPAALDQIREMDYAAKYRGEPGRTVHEVGLVFSRAQRNLVKADWESER
jgi:hypothetical protein